MSVRKILIANRGEIVLRVARTARRMGIATVAIFSEPDRDAPHVAACDEAIGIGGAAPMESYLRADAIITAARRSGADAVHPGYGFLSENAAFARAVEAAGLIWIGPPADAIDAMGDKARARVRMASAAVPVVPGYDGEDQSFKRMRKAAQEIGYPVMIKASAGGGGRGMRIVTAADDFDGQLKSAAAEAAKAFGNPTLILERAVEEPRHVEIQVFADSHGNVVHLGERDCSVQRRHQKVIEEAPSPAVSEQLREEMGACAVNVAREINYRGAGTVEFLLDRTGAFYFMEMNTRLQVEHPVTELVTGFDLVEWQIRVARGEVLPANQHEIKINGWAMEARLCAEDPGADYAPVSGDLLVWQAASFARTDAAIAAPGSVSPYYDSMLGKVIVHGVDRRDACSRLAEALGETVLLGVATNRVLLQRICENPTFIQAEDVSTGFLAKEFPTSESRVAAPDDRIWALAAWLSVVARPERERTSSYWRDWANSITFLAPWRLRHGAGSSEVERRGLIESARGGARVRISDEELQVVGAAGRAGAAFCVTVDGREMDVVYAWSRDDLWLNVKAHADSGAEIGDYAFADLRRAAGVGAGDAASADSVFSPLNGKVVSVDVGIGALVKKGQRVAVMEAMKMEHTLVAPRDGRVAAVHVKVGEQLKSRHKMLELEAVAAAGSS
jgi:geranyl-CoA carboxylase alpha subunit